MNDSNFKAHWPAVMSSLFTYQTVSIFGPQNWGNFKSKWMPLGEIISVHAPVLISFDIWASLKSKVSWEVLSHQAVHKIKTVLIHQQDSWCILSTQCCTEKSWFEFIIEQCSQNKGAWDGYTVWPRLCWEYKDNWVQEEWSKFKVSFDLRASLYVKCTTRPSFQEASMQLKAYQHAEYESEHCQHGGQTFRWSSAALTLLTLVKSIQWDGSTTCLLWAYIQAEGIHAEAGWDEMTYVKHMSLQIILCREL